jgi:hypothetical protein
LKRHPVTSRGTVFQMHGELLRRRCGLCGKENASSPATERSSAFSAIPLSVHVAFDTPRQARRSRLDKLGVQLRQRLTLLVAERFGKLTAGLSKPGG